MDQDAGKDFSSGKINESDQSDFNAAVNIPIIKDKLNTRIAAVYNTQDGYVKNTFGCSLNYSTLKRFTHLFL